MGFHFSIVKLLVLLIAGLIILVPSAIDSGPTPQRRAEQLVSSYLSEKGSYMALYFNDIDTAFTRLDEDSSYKELNKRVRAYQDSTLLFSRIDVAKSASFYNTYKKLNLQKDSTRIHYKPQPLGYLILHHFLFDGDAWTDSFTIDFNVKNILKIKETIE
jgi:hypothetical protein